MKVGKKSSSEAGSEIGPRAGITATNYTERARAFVALRGGVGFVIRALDGAKGARMAHQPATEPQWSAWMAYFDRLGVPTVFARSHGLATVPSEWPEEFDAEAPASDREAVLARGRAPDDYERGRIAGGFRHLGAEVARSLAHMDITHLGAKKHSWRNLTGAEASGHLEELKGKYAAEAPSASDELRAQFPQDYSDVEF